MCEHKKLIYKRKGTRRLGYYEGVGWVPVDVYECVECGQEFITEMWSPEDDAI